MLFARGLAVLFAVPVIAASINNRAQAAEDFVSTRALGLGGALRAAAIGDAGPLLNPSGMSLVKAYTLEAAYGYSTRRSDQFFHGSIVDTTSAFKIGGGAYYTYHPSAPAGRPEGSGHEAGLALSVPFSEYAAVGATGKYFRLRGDQAPDGNSGGMTVDLGITVRPHASLAAGFVATNVRDLHNREAPRTVGYGVAYNPGAELLLAVDGRTSFTDPGFGGHKGTSIMGGGELFLAHAFGLRAGGGYDAISRNGYLSLGFSAISEIGAFDVGARRDLFRGQLTDGSPSKLETILAASLRLFIPQP
ncbi:MAG TPA: hypothetical protein VFH73_16375 [Polyangia bacterium]|jgi:hypothetical protein|nr:hypothetical protein [Polyangia bacterium]